MEIYLAITACAILYLIGIDIGLRIINLTRKTRIK